MQSILIGVGAGVAVCLLSRLLWRRLRLRRGWQSFRDQISWSIRYAPRQYLVLDVGSGHNPHVRSDVLCEKYLEDEAERSGAVVSERPLVIGDAGALPFKSGAFDLLISRHMIEHLPDPKPFFEDAGRVARRGYFTTPSAVAEKLMSYPYHRWLIERQGDTLHFEAKERPVYDPALQRFSASAILNDTRHYDSFMLDHIAFLETRYWWVGTPKCVVEEDSASADFVHARTITDDGVVTHSLSSIERARSYLKTAVRRLAHMLLSRHDRVDLAPLLACPRCRGGVEVHADRVHCPNCEIDYPVQRGIPIMLADHAVTAPNRGKT